MANFERLVRKALASQDDSSAEVRSVIYQSSRNALQKIIDSNRLLTVEAVMAKKRELEDCIEKIETQYTNPAPEPQPQPAPEPQPAAEPEPQPEPQPAAVPEPQPEPQLAAEPELQPVVPVFEEPVKVEQPTIEQLRVEPTDPLHEIQQILESTSTNKGEPQPTTEPVMEQVKPQQVAPEIVEPVMDSPQVEMNEVYDEAIQGVQHNVNNDYEQPENIPLGFQKRRKTQKRFFWAIINLLILGLLAWIIYIAVTAFLSGDFFGLKEGGGPKLNPNSLSQQAEDENYITVINSGDLSSLVMSDRGKAEIVNQLNSEMIRIHSVRDAVNRSEPALPIMIRLKPGVLEQISGKRVTVEIFAKSGGQEQAHFAIGCNFNGLSDCGRKRFLAGSQPNASVFAFQMDQVSDVNQDMFLTLSTDTTNEAAVTGKGDILDIVYIRLSIDN